MRVIRVEVPRTAVTRAAAVWRLAAYHVRGQLREARVRGGMRPLDEVASGRRGKAVPAGVAAMAAHLHLVGFDADDIKRALWPAWSDMVDVVCAEMIANDNPPRAA